MERVLRRGDAIVLFDGLDEVSLENEKRGKLIDALNAFVYKYSDCPYLLSCRVAATDYSFTQFEYVEMADFDERQIGNYIDRWFVRDEETRQRCRHDLLKNPENKTVRELAQTPLLLSLLCLVYEELNKFPLERHELYDEAARALLAKWDDSRKINRDTVYKRLTLRRKQQMLATLAAQNFDEGHYFLKEKQLIKQIEAYLQKAPGIDEPDGELVLKMMEAQHGIFVERARGIHSFSHLTLQEYFTAKYIVEEEARGSVERMMAHVGDDSWNEVFLLTVGMLNDPEAFCRAYLVKVSKLIEADMQISKIVHWASEATAQLSLPYRAGATRALLIFRAYKHSSARKRRESGAILQLANSLDLQLALDHALHDAVSFDVDYAIFTDSILELNLNVARKFARQLNLNELANEFDKLKPDSKESEEIWHNSYHILHNILEIYRPNWDIHYKYLIGIKNSTFKELSAENAELLATVISASTLFVRCLEVTYLSEADRRAFEDQILLPPQ